MKTVLTCKELETYTEALGVATIIEIANRTGIDVDDINQQIIDREYKMYLQNTLPFEDFLIYVAAAIGIQEAKKVGGSVEFSTEEARVLKVFAERVIVMSGHATKYALEIIADMDGMLKGGKYREEVGAYINQKSFVIAQEIMAEKLFESFKGVMLKLKEGSYDA